LCFHLIAKPLGFIRDLKIFVHGIPYTVTFTIININVVDPSYSMLLGCPWLKDAKISHNWGINNVIIRGSSIIRTIPITDKLGFQTKRPKVLLRCDFHSGISDEKEDVMFTTKLNMFSIGTIAVSTHIELVLKPFYILDIGITKLIKKNLLKW
jgi:hypothetical protein